MGEKQIHSENKIEISIDEESKNDSEQNKVNQHLSNPWFNDEIAAIIKEHKKAQRKYYRTKTKKEEFKQKCKELKKKKEKLIKAAKQKYFKKVQNQKNVASEKQIIKKPENDQNENEESGYIIVYFIKLIMMLLSKLLNGYKKDVTDVLNSFDGESDYQWLVDIKNGIVSNILYPATYWEIDVDDNLE